MADIILVFVLRGSLESNHVIFSVKAARNISVADLNKLVFAEQRHRFEGLNVAGLVLWKVLHLLNLYSHVLTGFLIIS